MKEVSINCNGFQLRHTKTVACTREHNYETHPHLEQARSKKQIDFRCFLIVICDNTVALPCKRYC